MRVGSRRNSKTVAISLPKLAARLKPLDEQVHVALSIPKLVDPDFYRVNFGGHTYIDYAPIRVAKLLPSGAPPANHIILGASGPMSERLGEIIPRLISTDYRLPMRGMLRTQKS